MEFFYDFLEVIKFLSALKNKIFEQMKFFKKTLFKKELGVSVAISVNGNCKADGG